MSIDTANVKDILLRCNDSLYVNGILDRKLYSQTLEAFGIIAKNKLYNFTDEIYKLLSSSEPLIREEAIATLGFGSRLHLPDFKNQAYNIFIKDPDTSVRRTALAAWTSYFFETNDPTAFSILYKILRNENEKLSIRAEAYIDIFSVYKDGRLYLNPFTGSTPLIKCKTISEFNTLVKWNLIDDIMHKYSPNAIEKNNNASR